MPGGHERGGSATTGTGYGMEVDVVRQFIVRVVFQVKFHFIANAGTNKTTGHGAVKSPVKIFYTIGHCSFFFYNFHVHNEFGCFPVTYRFRHEWGRGEFSDAFTYDFHFRGRYFALFWCGAGTGVQQPCAEECA